MKPRAGRRSEDFALKPKLNEATLRGLPARAREAIRCRLNDEPLAVLDDAPLPSRGVFVTLFTKRDHALRGCIGRMSATQEFLDDEVTDLAVAAALTDPRFAPLRREELDLVDVEVSVLGAEEPVTDRLLLDPQRFGVVVRAGARTGVLLPHVDGVDDVDSQIGIALRKARIEKGEPYTLTRFEVVKVRETPAATPHD